MLERFPSAPDKAPFHVTVRLRNAYNRFVSTASARQDAPELEQPAILGWVDALLEHYVGFSSRRIARQHSIPEKLTAVLRIGSRSDTIRPHRVVFADEDGQLPALLVMADTSPQVGRGRGRTAYAHFLELLRDRPPARPLDQRPPVPARLRRPRLRVVVRVGERPLVR
jgi:hypothetical protein